MSSPTGAGGAFLVTVDTEGDNLWAKPRTVTTHNSAFLPRFQSLCEKYGLKPTYLTNWEMANCPRFVEFGRHVLANNAGEIGMHLHAWNSPPLVPLTEDDDHYAPYLVEYPPEQMREKIHVMTAMLQETFGVKMLSHRAGRWSFDQTYARLLADEEYEVDCSVTPHVSWKFCKGDPSRGGGTDYTNFPEHAYFLDLNDIRSEGASRLLELPMTIVRTRDDLPLLRQLRERLAGSFYANVALRKLFPTYLWLMPGSGNGAALLKVLEIARQQQRPYVQLAIHSSELMPGGSPTFPSAESIEKLYQELEALFSAGGNFRGMTLSEYREGFK